MEKQIDFLNEEVKLRLAPSKIHGVGIFAIRDIGKGQKLHAGKFPQMYNLKYSYFSKLFPEVRELLLERWPNITQGSGFCYPDTFLQAYMNHALGKEANYDAINDIAKIDIKAGEEILEDYRQIKGWNEVFPWLIRDGKKNKITPTKRGKK